MRDPLRRVLICFSLIVLGGGTAWLGFGSPNRTTADVLVGILSLCVAIVAAPAGFVALLSIRGYNRLRAGQGAIARWHVTAAEWDRFRSQDAVRAAEGPNLPNVLTIRWRTPAQGVDIIVGRDQILCDGYYHSIAHFMPDGRVVSWLAGDPDCLEFPVYLPAARGDAQYLTLRIPVPFAARADGLRVLDYYQSAGPQPLGMIF